MAAIIINIAPTICLPFNTSPKIKKANILDNEIIWMKVCGYMSNLRVKLRKIAFIYFFLNF